MVETLASSQPESPATAVALRDVSYEYPGGGEGGGHGVEEISLRLEAGSVLGLLGPNGSGKSTILSLVLGFCRPDRGEVTLLGEALTPALRRRLGVVFQEASLDPLMTARETLWLHGRLFGLRGRTLRRRAEALLELMGLGDRATDAVETLSGGMRRRLELARAVMHEPEVLLLDEPSLGLDPDSKAALWELLARINGGGTTLLLATNDVTEAEQACGRVAFLEAGRVVAEGSPATLKQALRRDSVRVEWPSAPADVEARLAGVAGVGQVTCAAPVVHVTVDDASAFVPELFRLAAGTIEGIRIHESTLEDAYFQHVGTPLSERGRENGRAGP